MNHASLQAECVSRADRLARLLFTCLVFVALAAGAGCASARDQIVPNWVDSGAHPEFADDRYLTAMGEGQTSVDADKLAFLRLAEQLKVDISGSTAIAKSYSSSNDQETFGQDVSLDVAARVDIKNIKGVRIHERHHDRDTGTHYSFAVLDRREAAAQLRVEIEHLHDGISSGLRTARASVDRGAPSQAFRAIREMDDKLDSLQLRLAEYSLFAPSRTYADTLARNRTVEQELVDFAAGLARGTRISPVGSDRRTAAVGQEVADPFQVRFEFSSGGRSLPLRNIPIAYSNDVQAFRVRADNQTDTTGVARFQISDVAYTQNEHNEILVGIDYRDPRLRSSFPETKLFVSVPRKSGTVVQVVVDVAGLGASARRTIENGIKAILLEDNYSVVGANDTADGPRDVRLEVSGNVAELPGIGRIKFARIVGSVKLTGIRSRNLIETIVLDSDAAKGGGLQMDRAAQKAASKLIEVLREPLRRAMESNVGRT